MSDAVKIELIRALDDLVKSLPDLLKAFAVVVGAVGMILTAYWSRRGLAETRAGNAVLDEVKGTAASLTEKADVTLDGQRLAREAAEEAARLAAEAAERAGNNPVPVVVVNTPDRPAHVDLPPPAGRSFDEREAYGER